MNTNLPSLFDLSKLEKRKTLSQKSFEQKNPDLLSAFSYAVFDSFKTFDGKMRSLVRPGGMVNSWPAASINSLIRSAMIEQFPAYCEKATKTRFKLVTDDQNVYFKKFNYRRRPTNRKSKANDLILYQLTNSNKDKGGNVFFGYTTDPVYSAPLGVYAICIEGDKLLWECDILDFLRKYEAAKLVRMTPKTKKTGLKAGTVTVKKKKTKKESRNHTHLTALKHSTSYDQTKSEDDRVSQIVTWIHAKGSGYSSSESEST
jgi:hypothetical protein